MDMRVQVTFSKTGPLKYIGNLDLYALWERAVRRAGLPLMYSNAFHPQPKINFASALPLGFTSRCEVVDLRLDQEIEPSDLSQRLQGVMPSGILILDVRGVEESSPALQTQVIAAEYEVTITETNILSDPSVSRSNVITDEDIRSLKHSIEVVMAESSLPRERRGKAYDLRPLIENLEVVSENKLFMRLTAREAATGRPEEVLDALGIAIENTRVERVNLIFQG
jgi:radical SAM-linked protein